MKKSLFIVLLLFVTFISCKEDKRDSFVGSYERSQDGSEIKLNLYEDSTFVYTSTSDVSKLEINNYPEKSTFQINGKWGLTNDSLQLYMEHMSHFGKSMEMNDTMNYKIIQFKDNILSLKSLSNNDIQEYQKVR